MALKTIFKKPVDRPIEGVIKADDEASLRLELDEYVLTNEVDKRLESFLDAYNSYEGANGVWISGFFGSGKSHLLKMLALLLENRKIDGTPALELFLPKCADNAILCAGLKRTVTVPSKSILFNIDQKADVISKTQIDALLTVFVKVFDEMCGYYGKQGYIAQFERDLDSRGLYEAFKTAYETQAGLSWPKGREQALLESSHIAQAYAQISDSDEALAKGILEKYRSQYRVSIEDFADQVKTYVDRQSPDFRLNFLVDEVGQYIANNVKLMTNLQTIAESLATKCRGRAWVIVTAQEDMNALIGEMGQQHSNDFSKIQARFANRMKLTSADVAEVIQKRLLAKTEGGTESVAALYRREANNFGTLFSFADGSRDYKIYRDEDAFVQSYPFIPYQFELFQSAIENLSRHSAFEGKHSSVGERSMLGVFQQVAVQISDYRLGQLASFDLMFEGVQTILKAQTQRAVLAAERQLDNGFAVKLLKALFLVKYVKEFKPTLRNLRVLMLSRFDQDLPRLQQQVEEALNLLEQQTYIQRNGERYEYLTDEEKDVEQEIKHTEVETTDVAAELEKIVFEHVIKSRKIHHNENGQDYSYSKRLDDRLHGREYELAIHVITPFHGNAGNEAVLVSQSLGRDELLVILPSDARLMSDILMYKRTEKYVRQNGSHTQPEEIKRILADKNLQNQERYSELQQRVQTLLSVAKLYVAGAEVEASGEDAQTRIVHGFYELISRAYPNRRMLGGVAYKEDHIQAMLGSRQGTLAGVAQLTESEQEVLAFVQSNSRGGLRTTLKKLLERFEHKPYGWPYAAVLCTLAKLCGRGKVEVRSDGNLLEDDALERALRNTRAQGNVVLEPQLEFSASQVRDLKTFYEDFFDASCPTHEAKALGQATQFALQQTIHELDSLVSQAAPYPFVTALTPALEKLKAISDKAYTWYLTELLHQEDELLDLKEQLIEPIRQFMAGSQKDIFDRAQTFVKEQAPNFSYIEGDAALQIIEALADPACFKGDRMKRVKTLADALREQLTTAIKTEATQAKDAVATLKSRLCGMDEFEALSPAQQEQIARPFAEFPQRVERQTLVAVIRDERRRFEDADYPRLLAQMTSWATPSGQDEHASTPKPDYVTIRSVQIPFDTAWLADETDVKRYLDSMRQALLTEIHSGKRIQI